MKRAPAALLISLVVAGCGDLATPPDPTALRNVDRVASSVTPGGGTYEIVDLSGPGLTYGYATAINAGGEVVGDFEDESRRRHAFRWSGAMTDLGTLGGPFSQTYAINTSGVAAGYAYLTHDVFHAVKWDGATITDLGTLPGDKTSIAISVGDGGHIVGTSHGSDDHAFVWHNGVMTYLPPILGGTTRAFRVNGTGDVVGTSDHGCGSVAVMWRNAAVTNLGTLGGCGSVAVDINDASQVVGTAELSPASFARHAFRWENGSMTDLGSLGGSVSEAIAINARGDVVGWSFTDASNSDVRGFLWRDGTMTHLGALPGGMYCVAAAINDVGQVAGSCLMSSTGTSRAFLWENGVMTDLGTLGGPASVAIRGINNDGHIVGSSETADGQTRPVLWRPAVITVVSIDVKPGSTTNPVNPKSKGVIPVAILGSSTFDATTVDVASVRFGPGNALASRGQGHVEDVNADGHDDMVLHFDTQASGITCGITTATLTGMAAGKSIRGSDTIVTVSCR